MGKGAISVGCVAIFIWFSRAAAAETPRTLHAEGTCGEIDAWIDANKASLPNLYDDFVALPLTHRIRMFQHLSPAVQAALWRTQLTRALEAENDLTDEQRELVTTIIAGLNTRSYSRRQAPLWEAAVARAFPDESVVYRLFLRLGGPDSRLVESGDGSASPAPNFVNICACGVGYFWTSCPFPTGPTQTCVHTFKCKRTPTGCGFLWREPCDGECRD